jgi:hypothetical protein
MAGILGQIRDLCTACFLSEPGRCGQRTEPRQTMPVQSLFVFFITRR